MPSTTPERLRRWGGEGGVGEDKAIRYLRRRGYVLTRTWFWIPPYDHEPTYKELDAMRFLIEEWDFGGFSQHVIDTKQGRFRAVIKPSTKGVNYSIIEHPDPHALPKKGAVAGIVGEAFEEWAQNFIEIHKLEPPSSFKFVRIFRKLFSSAMTLVRA